MQLSWIDFLIIAAFFTISLAIGVAVSKRAGSSMAEFFLSGRNMPWWLLGISMVATTFSADTPNLVTGLVRQKGVAGNWAWWAFLLTGMLTVFVYAKLWRRSGVLTDLEFYELRYSGKSAAFLRGFRALYLGILFNVFVMGTVCLAAVKMGQVMFGLERWQTLILALLVTMIYSSLSGLRGVLLTDFFQFIIAMIGSIWAAAYVIGLPEVGGLNAMLNHDNVRGKLSFLPTLFTETENGQAINPQMISLLFVPLAVQWWAAWYPGSEPGGGGYVAQRMLSARNERHAICATLLFNVAHYALRPWPWILIALASLVVFPDLGALASRFPDVPEKIMKDDLAYPAMLARLPSGLLGMVVASLIAAFMSTISTHLNWGSSYIVNDFYKRFLKPEATERELVRQGRLSTVVLIILAGIMGFTLEDATQAFQLILMLGAGTGLIYILRWFWWRINPAGEITAMVASFVVSVYFTFFFESNVPAAEKYPAHVVLVISVAITTLAWLVATLLTPPTDDRTLRRFYRLVRPGGPGWKAVIEKALGDNELLDENIKGWDVPVGIVCMLLGCLSIYGALFATGFWIYGNYGWAVALISGTVITAGLLVRNWSKLKTD